MVVLGSFGGFSRGSFGAVLVSAPTAASLLTRRRRCGKFSVVHPE